MLLVGGGLAFAPIAEAQWYASGNAGVAILSDADVTDTAAIGSFSGEVGTDNGLVLTGAVGYAWDAFRFEGELSYRSNDLDDLEITSLTLAGTTISGALGIFDLAGDTSAIGFMANGWYDVDTGTPWAPFIGAGLGIARVNLDIDSVGGAAVVYDESDTVFAYQVGAGIGYKVTPQVTVNLAYRFFGTSDPEFDDGVDKVDTEYRNHSLMFGVVSRF